MFIYDTSTKAIRRACDNSVVATIEDQSTEMLTRNVGRLAALGMTMVLRRAKFVQKMMEGVNDK